MEDQKLENVLPLAHGIRCVIEELLRQMSLLSDEEKVPDSPHLLSLFDQLSAVINEETIVEATTLADKGFVTLHTSDPTVTEKNGNTLLEEKNILDEDPGLTDLQIPMSVIHSQLSSLGHHLSSARFSQQSISVDLCEELFGAVSPKPALPVEEPTPEPSGTDRRIFEVCCGSSQDCPFYILPDINYCICDIFQKEVIQNRVDYTCPHVLSTWLSQALDTLKTVQTRPDLLDNMFSQIVDRIE